MGHKNIIYLKLLKFLSTSQKSFIELIIYIEYYVKHKFLMNNFHIIILDVMETIPTLYIVAKKKKNNNYI